MLATLALEKEGNPSRWGAYGNGATVPACSKLARHGTERRREQRPREQRTHRLEFPPLETVFWLGAKTAPRGKVKNLWRINGLVGDRSLYIDIIGKKKPLDKSMDCVDMSNHIWLLCNHIWLLKREEQCKSTFIQWTRQQAKSWRAGWYGFPTDRS